MATIITLFESENERQKIKPVPILLPRASRKFPDVKTRNDNGPLLENVVCSITISVEMIYINSRHLTNGAKIVGLLK